MYLAARDSTPSSACLGTSDMRVVALCTLNIVAPSTPLPVVPATHLFFPSVTRPPSRNPSVYRKFVTKWCFVMNSRSITRFTCFASATPFSRNECAMICGNALAPTVRFAARSLAAAMAASYRPSAFSLATYLRTSCSCSVLKNFSSCARRTPSSAFPLMVHARRPRAFEKLREISTSASGGEENASTTSRVGRASVALSRRWARKASMDRRERRLVIGCGK